MKSRYMQGDLDGIQQESILYERERERDVKFIKLKLIAVLIIKLRD